jgi:hypothetical protein
MRGGWGVSANEYICAHGTQINFGDLTPSLTYDCTFLRGCFEQEKSNFIYLTYGTIIKSYTWMVISRKGKNMEG